MKAIEALHRLQGMDADAFHTADAAAVLRISSPNAAKILERLAAEDMVVRLKRGLWCFPERMTALRAPAYVTAPMPCYISLHTALYHHGMISQIPAVTYAVSTARSRRYETFLGLLSIHHVHPAFCFGFQSVGRNNVPMAEPEKALLDVLYLSAAGNRLFRHLPEIEFPDEFDMDRARAMIQRAPAARLRTLLHNGLTKITSEADVPIMP